MAIGEMGAKKGVTAFLVICSKDEEPSGGDTLGRGPKRGGYLTTHLCGTTHFSGHLIDCVLGDAFGR